MILGLDSVLDCYEKAPSRKPEISTGHQLTAGKDRHNLKRKVTNMEAALHRKNDPITSVEAAMSVDVNAREKLVYEWLRANGLFGATAEEIAAGLGLERDSVSPRLKPMEKKGLVTATAQRRPGKSGKNQRVWIAV